MLFRNRIQVFGVGILAVGALTAGVPGVASAQAQNTTDVVVAAPDGCRAEKGPNGRGTAYCTRGNGQFRVNITCKESTGRHYQAQGPWTRPGPNARSTRWCSTRHDKITYAGVQKISG